MSCGYCGFISGHSSICAVGLEGTQHDVKDLAERVSDLEDEVTRLTRTLTLALDRLSKLEERK